MEKPKCSVHHDLERFGRVTTAEARATNNVAKSLRYIGDVLVYAVAVIFADKLKELNGKDV